MIYTSPLSSRRRTPLKRRLAVDFVPLPGKQHRAKEIRETPVYVVDARIQRTPLPELPEVEQFTQHCMPICRLPHDILTELAYIHSKVQKNGAWLFSAVCRTWRVAALCSPRAWTDIHLIALGDEPNGLDEYYGKAISHPPLYRIPNPALCISRAGIFPLSLEFHGLTVTTRDMDKFIAKVIPYVGRLCFHERRRCFLPVSRLMPKLRELLIVPEEGHASGGCSEVGRMFSDTLLKIFGTDDPAKCRRALNRLRVARFHEVNWDPKYFVGFRGLRDLTLHDCVCSPDDDLHQFLQANCGTLEYLHLSLTLSDEVQNRPLAQIYFSRLRTLSFDVAQRAQNTYRSNQSPSFTTHSHYIALFQSLIAPKATELQVYAPYIEDLDFSVHYPSLQHFRIIIPATMDDVFPCATSLKPHIRTSPLQSIDIFISTNHYKLPEREHGIAAILTSFLCDPLVLDHPTFTAVTIKLRPDFEPVWEQVSYHWMQRGKTLRIQGATNSECMADGFVIIQDLRPKDVRE